MSRPTASVVICTRERPELLAETVRSILQGDELPAEILVVDQSRRHDASTEAMGLPECPVRHIRSDSRGLSRARNIAARSTHTDIVVFCDDDMVLTSSWLHSLAEALAHSGPGTVVTGQVQATAPERRGSFAPAVAVGAEPKLHEGRLETDVLAGGNMALYRSTFDAAGGFDERLGAGSSYPSAEDNDLGLRLLERNYRILYVPEALAFHRSWRPRREYVPVRWRYGRGKGGFYAKHASLTDRHMLRRAAVDVGRKLVRLPRKAAVDPRHAVGDVFYSLGIIAGMAGWLLRERLAARLRARRRTIGP